MDCKHLTFKTLFLVAVTSARRISELGALSVNPNLCVFHDDKVILRPDPLFVPKVNTRFHRGQDVVLPSLCPKPSCPAEQKWHKLDVRRALYYYIERTKAFRKTITYLSCSRGRIWGSEPRAPLCPTGLRGLSRCRTYQPERLHHLESLRTRPEVQLPRRLLKGWLC